VRFVETVSGVLLKTYPVSSIEISADELDREDVKDVLEGPLQFLIT
jgi:hypothetical protein